MRLQETPQTPSLLLARSPLVLVPSAAAAERLEVPVQAHLDNPPIIPARPILAQGYLDNLEHQGLRRHLAELVCLVVLSPLRPLQAVS